MFPVPVLTLDRLSCKATDVLSRVGEKWSMLILGLLSVRAYGFNELDRTIEGLSRRILTRTLRTLEREGLVRRTPPADGSQRVEYVLTELGRSLLPLVVALGEWAERHEPAIRQARASYDHGLTGP
ncbi:winged helix-turn-helix transcriptional regulator [Allorhizocola rhizosphaerae]|uniref:winged helix-turn-helix transcriptional regulator n=1 Tax=Allorhizocola rhizosphaerae TaxID=1872709 RepID=UPI000E3C59E7|nr:helix-turn-helix domain-containing protein [Allorhizocola rhizosphaerae]